MTHKQMENLIPTWSTLRGLSSNRTIRSANVWALIVPISAKLLEKIQDVLTIELSGVKYQIYLSLPFSWKVLFIAAIAFLFANIIFGAFCPKLIRETKTYRDFTEQKRSCIELQPHFTDADLNIGTAEWTNWFAARNVTKLVYQTSAVNIGPSPEHEDRATADAYAIVVAALSKTNRGARLVVSFLYGVGLIAVSVILFQNICFVINHW